MSEYDLPPHERPERGPLKLPKIRRWTVYFVSFGVWLTGAVWLIYRYFLRTEGKFGQVRDPLEAWWLKAHGLFSFWTLWIFGLLWSVFHEWIGIAQDLWRAPWGAKLGYLFGPPGWNASWMPA